MFRAGPTPSPLPTVIAFLLRGLEYATPGEVSLVSHSAVGINGLAGAVPRGMGFSLSCTWTIFRSRSVLLGCLTSSVSCSGRLDGFVTGHWLTDFAFLRSRHGWCISAVTGVFTQTRICIWTASGSWSCNLIGSSAWCLIAGLRGSVIFEPETRAISPCSAIVFSPHIPFLDPLEDRLQI